MMFEFEGENGVEDGWRHDDERIFFSNLTFLFTTIMITYILHVYIYNILIVEMMPISLTPHISIYK